MPESLRIVIDVLFFIGLLFCFMGLLAGAAMVFDGNAREWVLVPVMLISGAACCAAKVLAHEGEKRGRVAFLSSEEQDKAVVDSTLTLPPAGSAGGSLRPGAVVDPKAEELLWAGRRRFAGWALIVMGSCSFALAINDPPYMPAVWGLLLTLLAVAGMFAAKLWRLLRLMVSGLKG